MIATECELWAGKWCFEMSYAEENVLRLRYEFAKIRGDV